MGVDAIAMNSKSGGIHTIAPSVHDAIHESFVVNTSIFQLKQPPAEYNNRGEISVDK